MMLLIDIGNTNLRWALSHGATPGEMHILRHGGGAPLDLLAAWEQLDAPSRVIASNVAGPQVAEAIGAPTSVRAVASACAANRVAVLIPCHRVIRGDGDLAGFRWGIQRKRALLANELTC